MTPGPPQEVGRLGPFRENFSEPAQEPDRRGPRLGALDGHREADHGVDLSASLGLVQSQTPSGLLGDGTGDVLRQFRLSSVPQALLHDGGMEPLRCRDHAGVRLRELDHHEAVVALQAGFVGAATTVGRRRQGLDVGSCRDRCLYL